MRKLRSALLVLIIVALIVVPLTSVSASLPSELLLPYNFVVAHSPYLGFNVTNSQPIDGNQSSTAGTSIIFLNQLYSLGYTNTSAEIKKLANFLISIQYVANQSKNWYGGVPTQQGGTFYYSIDAAFAGEAFLDAYNIFANSSYLTGAKRCASFLRHMQTRNLAGVVDQYYGGFCEYQRSDTGAYLTEMFTKLLVALPFLKSLYQITGNSTYNTMAQDARSFLGNGLAGEYEYYNPKPYGDDLWHREPPNESVVFGDSMAYALRGVYGYEGLSSLVKNVYDFFEGFSGYDTRFAWAGYLNVVNKTYYSNYYDVATGGILSGIRAAYDTLSLSFQHNKTVQLGSTAFYWGLNFTYQPISGSYQHTTTVADIGLGLAIYDSYKFTSYQLKIASSPSPVSFTLNSLAQSTPYSNMVSNGTYRIIFTSPTSIAGTTWTFAYWNDNASLTNPSRTINLQSNCSYSVTYASTPIGPYNPTPTPTITPPPTPATPTKEQISIEWIMLIVFVSVIALVAIILLKKWRRKP